MKYRSKRHFITAHWKLAMHLLFRTRHIGVNNEWWSIRPSIWGLPVYRIIFNIIFIFPTLKNYTAMKTRMGRGIAFVPGEEYDLLFKN